MEVIMKNLTDLKLNPVFRTLPDSVSFRTSVFLLAMIWGFYGFAFAQSAIIQSGPCTGPSNQKMSELQVLYDVPDRYPTIQIALDTTPDWGTIIVGPGVYEENIDFNGKNIHLKSANGAKRTIIDGNRSGAVVTFQNGEEYATLNGFTITNGASTASGGIRCVNSSPTIKNNIIVDNDVQGSYCGGAAIYCYSDSYPLIIDNIIVGNKGGMNGTSGICCLTYSSPDIINNNIVGNDYSTAGVIYCEDHCSPYIADNNIVGNYSDDGGGIYCKDYCSPTISDNIIAGNEGSQIGGGILCYNNSSPIITNTLISWNRSSGDGGGVYCSNGCNPFFTNCTITHNMSYEGGGLALDTNSSPTITNCIVYGNYAYSELYNDGTGDPIVEYCDIAGGYPGTGNIDADPEFRSWWDPGTWSSEGIYDPETYLVTLTDEYGYWETDELVGKLVSTEYLAHLIVSNTMTTITVWADNWTLEDGYSWIYPGATYEIFDFHLEYYDSPCIDVGNNNAPALPLLDFDGDDRIIDGDEIPGAVVDIGADEFAWD